MRTHDGSCGRKILSRNYPCFDNPARPADPIYTKRAICFHGFFSLFFFKYESSKYNLFLRKIQVFLEFFLNIFFSPAKSTVPGRPDTL